MYKRQKTIIRSIHYNMAVARFLTTTLRLCCALHTKFLRLLTIVIVPTAKQPVRKFKHVLTFIGMSLF